MVDEIKLSPGVKFNRSTLKFEGIIDVEEMRFGKEGEDDEDLSGLEKRRQDLEQKVAQAKAKQQEDGVLGDHAVGVMFRPYKGDFVQALGCFLTKSNAKADELELTIL